MAAAQPRHRWLGSSPLLVPRAPCSNRRNELLSSLRSLLVGAPRNKELITVSSARRSERQQNKTPTCAHAISVASSTQSPRNQEHQAPPSARWPEHQETKSPAPPPLLARGNKAVPQRASRVAVEPRPRHVLLCRRRWEQRLPAVGSCVCACGVGGAQWRIHRVVRAAIDPTIKKNKNRIALDPGVRTPQMLIRVRVAGTHFWPTRPTRASAILSFFSRRHFFFFPFYSFFSQLLLFPFFFSPLTTARV